MSSSVRRENIEKDKKTVWAKEIVTANPIFSQDDIQVFFKLFNLYADQRRQANIFDIINTAKTLGFDTKHKLIYDAFLMIADENESGFIRFEPFLTSLTNKLGNPFTEEGRKAMFYLVDLQGKQRLTYSDLIKICEYLGFNFSAQEVQKILKGIVGSGKKQLTWDQFNEHITKKIQKKNGLQRKNSFF